MGENAVNGMVPKSVDEVIVSAHIPWTLGVKLPGTATSAKHGFRELKADILMLSDNEHLPFVDIRGFLSAGVAGGLASNTQAAAISITSKLVWKPAIDLLTAEELQRTLNPNRGTEGVTEYIGLLHHSNPGFSVLEIPSKYSLLTEGGLSNISKTEEVTIPCKDAELKAKLHEAAHDTFIESLDFTEELSSEPLEGRSYDVFTPRDLGSFDTQAELMLSDIAEVLKPGGKVFPCEQRSRS